MRLAQDYSTRQSCTPLLPPTGSNRRHHRLRLRLRLHRLCCRDTKYLSSLLSSAFHAGVDAYAADAAYYSRRRLLAVPFVAVVVSRGAAATTPHNQIPDPSHVPLVVFINQSGFESLGVLCWLHVPFSASIELGHTRRRRRWALLHP